MAYGWKGCRSPWRERYDNRIKVTVHPQSGSRVRTGSEPGLKKISRLKAQFQGPASSSDVLSPNVSLQPSRNSATTWGPSAQTREPTDDTFKPQQPARVGAEAMISTLMELVSEGPGC